MADVMDRLRKLLAMAESPVVEEARTAALMAARLIKENKIVLLLPNDARLTATTMKPVIRQYDQPIRMRARTHGLCMACGGPYFMDEPVLSLSWRTTHQTCAAYWSD